MLSEQDLGRRSFVEGPGAVKVGFLLAGRTADASGKVDDDLDADGSDHLTLAETDANRVVGVDQEAV